MVEKRSIPSRIRRGPGIVRDPRLIIIATEGRKTEKKYFEDFAFQSHNSQIKVHVLENPDDRSSPEHVLEVIEGFKDEYALEEDDLLWLVIDVDRWPTQDLSTIAQECNQKGYFLAISNPAFEIWLLLHLKNINDYSADQKEELLLNWKEDTNRTRLEREIIKLLGSYNKSNVDTGSFLPFINLAIARARELDIHPDHRWPNHLGTRVYLLAELILGSMHR
jgi:hypothetical protein